MFKVGKKINLLDSPVSGIFTSEEVESTGITLVTIIYEKTTDGLKEGRAGVFIL
jgi:hypothetical protein